MKKRLLAILFASVALIYCIRMFGTSDAESAGEVDGRRAGYDYGRVKGIQDKSIGSTSLTVLTEVPAINPPEILSSYSKIQVPANIAPAEYGYYEKGYQTGFRVGFWAGYKEVFPEKK